MLVRLEDLSLGRIKTTNRWRLPPVRMGFFPPTMPAGRAWPGRNGPPRLTIGMVRTYPNSAWTRDGATRFTNDSKIRRAANPLRVIWCSGTISKTDGAREATLNSRWYPGKSQDRPSWWSV